MCTCLLRYLENPKPVRWGAAPCWGPRIALGENRAIKRSGPSSCPCVWPARDHVRYLRCDCIVVIRDGEVLCSASAAGGMCTRRYSHSRLAVRVQGCVFFAPSAGGQSSSAVSLLLLSVAPLHAPSRGAPHPLACPFPDWTCVCVSALVPLPIGHAVKRCLRRDLPRSGLVFSALRGGNWLGCVG